MAESSGFALCFAFLCFIAIPAVILILLSFSSLQTIEYGLDYNAITMAVGNNTFMTAGLYFLGFGHSFIKFPQVIQTLEFTPGHRGRLHTRTSDGLPLTLAVSFQYRYLSPKLYDLYMNFKGEHGQVYINTATAAIANIACKYKAYTFFSNKEAIALDMEQSLEEIFAKELYAHVEALQIAEVELPEVFQQAIVTSISTKQNITQAQRYKENMYVTFKTQQLVASQEKEQTINVANGTAKARFESAAANAQITAQTVQAEMQAYGAVARELKLSPSSTLDYMWWDLLQQDAADPKDFLIGVNPAAYIKQ